MGEETGGFAQTYGVELLFEELPSISPEALLRAVRKYRPAAEPLNESDGGTTLAVLHPDYPVRFADGTMPAQTCVLPTDKPFRLTEALEDDLHQSWNFPEAQKVVGRCRHTVLVTDLMSSPLDY